MICFNKVYRVSLTKSSYFFPIAKSTLGPNGSLQSECRDKAAGCRVAGEDSKWLVLIVINSLINCLVD